MGTDDLMARALAARERAHAPYSGFKVGAAVRDEAGAVHVGCNVENAAYPEGICAETAALAALVVAGGRRAVEIAIAGSGEQPVVPCGGCRQRLAELAGPELPIRTCDRTGTARAAFTLAGLLPNAFDRVGLKRGSQP